MAGTFAAQRDVLTRWRWTASHRLWTCWLPSGPISPRRWTARHVQRVATEVVQTTPRPTWFTTCATLEPTLRSLADVGPELDKALSYFTAFGQDTIDRAIRGDYLNQFVIFDFTVPRRKKTHSLGTRWGSGGAKLVPARG